MRSQVKAPKSTHDNVTLENGSYRSYRAQADGEQNRYYWSAVRARK